MRLGHLSYVGGAMPPSVHWHNLTFLPPPCLSPQLCTTLSPFTSLLYQFCGLFELIHCLFLCWILVLNIHRIMTSYIKGVTRAFNFVLFIPNYSRKCVRKIKFAYMIFKGWFWEIANIVTHIKICSFIVLCCRVTCNITWSYCICTKALYIQYACATYVHTVLCMCYVRTYVCVRCTLYVF